MLVLECLHKPVMHLPFLFRFHKLLLLLLST